MNLNAWMTFLRLPDLGAQLGLNRDAEGFIRLHFLHAAATTGLLKRLRTWTELEQRTDDLDALLEVGVALGELERDGHRYRIRGKRAAALADVRGDALVAIIEEYVTYHAAVYRDFPDRLKTGQPGDYLAGKGEMVARSSRMLEPFMTKFVRQNVTGKGVLTMLEIGCGSGIYLRHAAEENPQATGIGIDLQADVVGNTTTRLASWGLASRFRVMQADIRQPTPELTGPFDLITLYNNIYYFPANERIGLLRSLRDRLKPGGALALTSFFAGNTVHAANFDMVLASTLGCAPMGTIGAFTGQLHEAGFTSVTTTCLLPGQPFYGVIAKQERN